MNNKALTYDQAFEELQQLISDIELGEISVDILSTKVKRASELITFCKQKLTTTEDEVQKILQELKNNV
ncbi:MAG TPA: exodeoxyribonuclease VII small subunit [Fluviicola sp.]|nr:exodeoxyribonuclease VII small subunit [Fluviicola sp.]